MIALGQTPVFIVSPDGKSGNRLAILLSKNLDAPRHFARLEDNIEVHQHYFSNDAVRRVLHGIRKSYYTKVAESLEKVALLLRESADNGRLWGLELNYELFFRLELYKTSPAYFIFLYDDAANIDGREAAFLGQIADFVAEHTAVCSVMHTKQVDALPELVLSALPFACTESYTPHGLITLKEERSRKKAKPDTGEDEDEEAPVAFPEAAHIVLQRVAQMNTLASYAGLLAGNELMLVFYQEDANTEALGKKLEFVSDYFIAAPALQLICNGESATHAAQHCLGRHGLKADVMQTEKPVAAVNRIIAESSKPFVVFEQQGFFVRYDQLLRQFSERDHKSLLVLGGVTAAETLALSDVLTTHVIHELAAFPKALWEQACGFDEALQPPVILWDLAIRTLHSGQAKVTALQALALEGRTEERDAAAMLSLPSYQQLIVRHEGLFEENARQLIGLLSEHLHQPQHRIKDLHGQITTLQTMQTHARNELRAVNELTASLQKRVHILEDRWYYKLGAKVKRLRKIFFKKNAGGTGRLRKILSFLSFTLSKPGMNIIRNISGRGLKKLYLYAETRPVQIVYLDEPSINGIRDYDGWVRYHQKPAKIADEFKATISKLPLQPKISIVMPVYNPEPKFLRAAIESVLCQDYRNWELCIADDCSPREKVGKLLRSYMLKDSRIKVAFRTENGHISACTNTALALATGDYVLFMDHDDKLSYDCLFEVIKHINEHPENDIIYSDEDKFDDEKNEHVDPHFKPDWAPDNLLSRNYMGHVVVMKKQLVDHIGGFRLGFEGSQDYDLLLRATECTDNIGHIPKVLYHWRIHTKSAAQSEDVKPYAYVAAKKALEEALQRRNTPGTVSYLSGLRGYRIRYEVKEQKKVSIIIPTKDQTRLLKNTIDSILHRTGYRNFEIIVLNNNSNSKDFFQLMATYAEHNSDCICCIDCNFPFNFARLMNIGAQAATGDYLLLLNNDVEIIHEDWLELMVGYAQQPAHGAVGVKLLYPDDHIQHAGVIVGLGGVAGHAFVNAYKDAPGYFNYIQSLNNFSAVTAACLMCRKEVYEAVGGMDEQLEVEYNDVDLCLRFLEAGYYNIYVPDVELYHFESVSRGHPHQSRESYARHKREIGMFKSRWQRYIDHDPFYNPNLNLGAHDFSMDFSAGLPDSSRAKAAARVKLDEDATDKSILSPKSAKRRKNEKALLN